ncbi:MAG: hypothetical protein HZB52_02405 [Chloroflexi bacterium]|nr:hypothetical protein [Chloroflexota bacterium]
MSNFQTLISNLQLPITNYKRLAPLMVALTLLVATLACELSTDGGTPGAQATLDRLLTESPKTSVPSATFGGVFLNPTVTPSGLIQSTPRPLVTATLTPIQQVETLAPQSTSLPPTESPTAIGAGATATPVRTATRAPVIATAIPLARPNGILLRAPRRSATIDGDLSEWGALPYAINAATYKPENISGASDNSATFGLGWDATYLYVAVNVIDDVYVQTQTGNAIYKGDSIEILFDADLRGDFNVNTLNGDDVQLGLSIGNPSTANPAAQAFIWYPSRLGGAPGGVRLAGKLTSNGYTVEAAIPWTALTGSGSANNRYGFVISVSDNDTPSTADQQSLISSVATRKLFDPTSWGTLVLDP